MLIIHLYSQQEISDQWTIGNKLYLVLGSFGKEFLKEAQGME